MKEDKTEKNLQQWIAQFALSRCDHLENSIAPDNIIRLVQRQNTIWWDNFIEVKIKLDF